MRKISNIGLLFALFIFSAALSSCGDTQINTNKNSGNNAAFSNSPLTAGYANNSEEAAKLPKDSTPDLKKKIEGKLGKVNTYFGIIKSLSETAFKVEVYSLDNTKLKAQEMLVIVNDKRNGNNMNSITRPATTGLPTKKIVFDVRISKGTQFKDPKGEKFDYKNFRKGDTVKIIAIASDFGKNTIDASEISYSLAPISMPQNIK